MKTPLPTGFEGTQPAKDDSSSQLKVCPLKHLGLQAPINAGRAQRRPVSDDLLRESGLSRPLRYSADSGIDEAATRRLDRNPPRVPPDGDGDGDAGVTALRPSPAPAPAVPSVHGLAGAIAGGIWGDVEGLAGAALGKHWVLHREIDSAPTGLFPAKAGPTKAPTVFLITSTPPPPHRRKPLLSSPGSPTFVLAKPGEVI